jgi:hypothetical protein
MKAEERRWYGVITVFLVATLSFIDRMNIPVSVAGAGLRGHLMILRTDRSNQGFLEMACLVALMVGAVCAMSASSGAFSGSSIAGCAFLVGLQFAFARGWVLWLRERTLRGSGVSTAAI